MKYFSKKNYKCRCCGYYTLPERTFGDICPVCFWEEDTLKDQDEPSAANHGLSLSQARENFRTIGACEMGCLKFVRKPEPEELSGREN